MAYNISFDASNKADFIVDFSATDADTGDDVDFTGADISIKIGEDNCTPIISASIGSGITLTTPTVFELSLSPSQMATLVPGSYRLGGVFTLNGITIQLLIGTLVIYDGIAQA